MKTFKFVPSICKKDGSTWEGYVVIKAFSFDEKFEFLQELDLSSDAQETKGNIERTRQMVRLSEKFYIEVALKNLATEEEIKSFEDMSYCEELHETLIEVGTKLLTGFKVGNV